MFFYIILLACVCIHLFLIRKNLTALKVVEILLMYFLVTIIGGAGIWAFIGHAFVPDKIANLIGWPAGNPFQYEVAMANLAIGTLGILCLWIKDKFWLATIIAASIFLAGDGFVHIHQMIANNNYAHGNAGWPLYCDFINPAIMVVLYIILKNLSKKELST